jgi:surfeit locus 1 family protein
MTARMARRFRPRLWTTVATLPVLALLIGLGVWQLQRLEWKNNLIAEMEARMDPPAMALPDPLPDTLDTVRFRRVELTGRFLHDRELYRKAQPLKNTRGAYVLTPLTLTDGRQILVNRGWVPLTKLDPAERPDSQPAGEITIDAIVRRGGWDGFAWLRPANDPAGNTWLWMDLPRMTQVAGLSRPVTRVYVDAVKGATPGSQWPIGGQTRVNLRNDHLNYALTWFALAVGLAIIYVLFHLRREPSAAPTRETETRT